VRVIVSMVLTVLVGTALSHARGSDPRLPYRRSYAAARNEAHITGKPLVVVFTAAWCPVCKRMEDTVLRQPEVVAMADQFVWALVDIDRELTLARDHGVLGVPTIEFLSADEALLGRHVGMLGTTPLVDRLQEIKRAGSYIPSTSTDLPGPTSQLVWRPDGYRGSGICFSHVGYGPLSVVAQSAFQSLRLGMQPRTPSTLGKGQYEIQAFSTWSNFWAVDGDVSSPDKRYFLDYETLQTTLGFAYGISDKLELEVEYQGRSRFGGQLDGLSEGFHDLFGIDQNGRDEVEHGLFRLDLDPGDGRGPVSLDRSDRGAFSRTLGIAFQHNLTCGSRRLPAISYSVELRHDLRNRDLRGGNDLDVGVSVSASRRIRRFYFYGSLGNAWFGNDDFRGLELRDTQWSAMLAVEWRFWARASLLLHWLGTAGLVDDFDPFDKRADEFTLGIKTELRDRGVLEIGLIENLISFDNTPDVGYHIGFRQRY